MADTGKSGSKRLPEGKRQMLCILDEDVIERVKIAAVKGTPDLKSLKGEGDYIVFVPDTRPDEKKA